MDSWGIQAKGTWATLRNNNRYKVNWDEGAKQRLQTGRKRVWGRRLKLQLKDTWTRQKHWQHTELLRGVRVKLIKQKRIWTRKCWDKIHQFSSVQSLSRVWLFATAWTAAHQASLSITNSQSLFKLMSLESVMPSNYLTLNRPLLLQPSIFPSIRVFSNELSSNLFFFFLVRWYPFEFLLMDFFANSFYLLIIPKKIVTFSLIIVWKKSKTTKNFHELGSIFHLYGTRAYIHIW